MCVLFPLQAPKSEAEFVAMLAAERQRKLTAASHTLAWSLPVLYRAWKGARMLAQRRLERAQQRQREADENVLMELEEYYERQRLYDQWVIDAAAAQAECELMWQEDQLVLALREAEREKKVWRVFALYRSKSAAMVYFYFFFLINVTGFAV